MDIKEKNKSSKFITIGLTIAATLASLIIIGLLFGEKEEPVKEDITSKVEEVAAAKEEEVEIKYFGFDNIEKVLTGDTLESWKKLERNKQIKMWNYFNDIMNNKKLEEPSKKIIQNYMIEGVFLGKDNKELFKYIEDRIENLKLANNDFKKAYSIVKEELEEAAKAIINLKLEIASKNNIIKAAEESNNIFMNELKERDYKEEFIKTTLEDILERI